MIEIKVNDFINSIKSLTKVKEHGFTLESTTLRKPIDYPLCCRFRFSFPFYIKMPEGESKTVKIYIQLEKLEVGWEFMLCPDSFDETGFECIIDRGFCIHSTEIEALLEFTKEVDTLITNIE
jgi:hypothetical protein